MPPNLPPTEPQRPGTGQYYRQVSAADPLAEQPQGKPSNFEFMLKDQPKPKRSFGLPVNRAGKLLVIGAGILIVVIILASIFGGGTAISKQVVDLMAQDQEIIRVSQLEDNQFTDANVLNLSATTKAIMQSQQSDFSAYLKKIKVKYSQKQLAGQLNKSTDTQLLTAAQNNNLEGAYISYLKNTLVAYQSSMSTVYKAAKSKTLRTALQSAYNSVSTLLKSPQFAPSSNS